MLTLNDVTHKNGKTPSETPRQITPMMPLEHLSQNCAGDLTWEGLPIHITAFTNRLLSGHKELR